MEKRILVLHHNDNDGFASAFAAWYGLWLECPPDQTRPEMKFIPVQYGQDIPMDQIIDFQPDAIYILDFSYSLLELQGLKELYPHLCVVDHHKTAQEALQGLDYCLFDINHAACELTWKLLCPDLPIPAILGYCADYDMWKFELPESKAVNLYIDTLEKDFMVWLDFSMEKALACGQAIMAFRDRQVEHRVKAARIVKLGEYEIPCVNASENISELGHQLCLAFPDSPFSMSYCDREDGKRSCSLRSIGDFDVSTIAKQFRGGGHKNAAGFTLDVPGVL